MLVERADWMVSSRERLLLRGCCHIVVIWSIPTILVGVSEVSVSGKEVSGMRVASSLGWPVVFFFFLFGSGGTRSVMMQSCHVPPSYISARIGLVDRVLGVRVISRSPNPLS